jgi:hypothetical protein
MTDKCDMQAIQDILKTSRKNNEINEVTGALCFDEVYFMQCLEGPVSAVSKLFETIEQDDRHSEVVVLESCRVHERLFGKWTMAMVKSSEIKKQILTECTGSARFEPHLLSGDQARVLLKQIFAKASNPMALP